MEIPTSRTTFPLRIPRRSKALGYLVEGLFINRGLESKSPTDTRPWTVGLETGAGDGFTGFVHQVVIDHYLNYHESPEDIEVYFCGPPLMNQAVEKMADDFGIPPENVRYDDFGG